MTPAARRSLAPAFVALLAAGLMLWLFAPVWFGGRSFAYRDGAHFYYPLFHWTAAEWGAGRIPLWNPQESCGVPVLADTTASVFYPGKLLFAAPFSFATNYVLYVTLHVVLAAVTAYLVARRWRASCVAAGVCSLSYAFSGSVLFQYCNVVFLVSAAWLPLALLAVDHMLTKRSVGAAIALGAVLALMTLGGDPQSAYHVGLAAVLYAVLLWLRRRRAIRLNRRSANVSAGGRLFARLLAHRFTLLSIAAASGFILAAVQILPGVQWSRLSDRAAYSRPRNVYEAVGYVSRRGVDRADTWSHTAGGLFGEPRAAMHHRDAYDFSVAPWRIAELVWPNISGTSFPVNRRWANLIPAEGRIWTPSLYMGVLPFFLALSAWRVRRAPTRVRWLSWTALLFTLGSLGWYGLGWLIEELRNAVWQTSGEQPLLGMPVGGLYWLMNTLLPAYTYFRYPAKLLVFTALALSVLAARGFDRLFRQDKTVFYVTPKRDRNLQRVLLAVFGVSLSSAVAMIATRSWLISQFAAAPTDDLFGPIDAAGACGVVTFALLQTAIVVLVGWCILLGQRRRPSPLWSWGLLFVVALDLGVANGWMIANAPRELWTSPSRMEQRIAAMEENPPTSYRLQRALADRWTPSSWARQSSPQRFQTAITWDRDTLLPKYPLLGKQRLAESFGTLSHHDFRVLMNIARNYGLERDDKITEPHGAVLDLLSVRWLIVPHGFEIPETELIPPDNLADEPADADLRRNPAPLPRAWLVHEVEVLPPLTSTESAVVGRRTAEVLFPNWEVRDFRRQAVVEFDPSTAAHAETAERLNELSSGRRSAADETDACRLLIDEPQRVVVACETDAPALLVLSDLDYPGWTAEIHRDGESSTNTGETSTILKTNRIMRGVVIPPGRHRVEFRYRPTMFYVGALLSSLGWLAASLLCIVAVKSRRKRRQQPAV